MIKYIEKKEIKCILWILVTFSDLKQVKYSIKIHPDQNVNSGI